MSESLNLYPPIIDNSISAFIKNDVQGMCVRFYFNSDSTDYSLDKVYAKVSVGGAQYIARDYEVSPVYEGVEIIPTLLKNKELYQIYIPGKYEINTPYLVQLSAYYDEKRSDLSDGVIKYALAPLTFDVYGGLTYEQSLQVSLSQQIKSKKLSEEDENETQASTYRLRGVLSFAQEEDPQIFEEDILQWWQVVLVDKESGEQLYTSEKLYPDRSWDTSSKIVQTSLDLSDQSIDEKFSLVVLFATSKGYISYQNYVLTIATENKVVDQTIQISQFEVTADNEIGGARISAQIKNTSTSNDTVGTWQILRRNVLQENENSYKIVYEKTEVVQRNTTITLSYLDLSLEAGLPYIYQIAFRIDSNNSESISYAVINGQDTSEIVAIDLEDMYLSTKDTILRIRYDPTLTNYKRNVVDVITPTLGGEYPFVRRNGKQKYRSFTIGGLISYHANELGELVLKQAIGVDSISNNDSQAEEVIISSSSKFSLVQLAIEDINYLENFEFNSQTQEYIKEKIFREKVFNFLYSNNTFLFRSFSEGNIFVRLSNISLTSNKTLGRNIYSFSATATEVMAPSAENYASFFSDLYTSSNFLLRYIYIKGTYANNSALLSAGEQLHKSAQTWSLTTVTSIIKYKIADGNGGYSYTEKISADYTYLDEYNREVPLINGMFYPGFFPEVIIEEKEADTTTTIGTYGLNVYNTEITFN